MRLRPTTLRARLTLWYMAALATILALLSATLFLLLDRGLRNNVDASLRSFARTIADSARQPSFLEPDLEESLESMFGPRITERLFQLLDPFGRPDPSLTPRRQPRLPLSPEALRNAERGEETFETITLPGKPKPPMRLLTLPIISNGARVHIVQVAISLENVEATRSGFLFTLLSVTPLALVVSGFGGWFLARRALAPVDAIVETACKIEAEDLSCRLPTPASNDELGRLAAVLNDMLARLDRSFAAARRFSAGAAHELRTPLTILMGELEVALRSSPSLEETREIMASCLEEVHRLNTLVEDLLLMARMEGNVLSLPAKPVNLAEVVEEVSPALSALAEKAGNACKVIAAPPLWVQGYDSLLFRLLFNLAENAIKYTPKGGHIQISLREHNRQAVLEVKDDGPGIPADEQERIFDPFYRGDPARQGSGTGLGLVLVRSIVQFHKGEIVLSSTVGEGSCFRVTLPISSTLPSALPVQD